MKTTKRAAIAALTAGGLLSGCTTIDRLSEVGRPPNLTPITEISNPFPAQKIAYPTQVEPPTRPTSNSLWRPGSKTLLKDQRAARLGDVLTVDVQFSDSATLENETSRERSNSDALNLGSLFGYASKIAGSLPGNPTLNPASALGSSGSALFKGTGSAQRKESVRLKVAVVIVDQLRNGNFVVSGRQELRVNNELREVVVGGIVRPQDIDAENTIASEKIAEARITYGGRGIITDYQQPPVGSQIVEILRPF
jgi:flagellar L-ring protein FlgH